MRNLVTKALIPVAVITVFSLARRYFPAKQPIEPGQSPSELSERFQRTQWIFGVSMIAVGVLFAICTHALLVGLNQNISFSKSPEGLRLWPQSAIWWFFPGFGALALSWEMTLLLWSTFGSPDDAKLYDYWNTQKAEFDCRKVLRWMALIIATPIGILSALATPMHSTLRQSDIIDCGYGISGCQTYKYSEAWRVTQVDGFRNRDGKLTKRAGIVIDFKDGRRWSSSRWGDFSERVDPAIANLLESKTGLAVQHAQAEEDVGR
jgi:hypothetical protein